jgi:hypothetical protein
MIRLDDLLMGARFCRRLPRRLCSPIAADEAVRTLGQRLAGREDAFLDVDVVRVREEVLPARFGGCPTDYQLAENEAADGRPRLRLLARPARGPLDETGVVDAFLTSIGRGAGAEEVMARMWRDAGFLQVERRPLYPTATGKILHRHGRRTAGAGAGAP